MDQDVPQNHIGESGDFEPFLKHYGGKLGKNGKNPRLRKRLWYELG